MTMNKTKVITGKDTRLSYFNGWEPKSINVVLKDTVCLY